MRKTITIRPKLGLMVAAFALFAFACGGLGYGTWDISYDCYPGGVQTGGRIWECERSVCESGMCGGNYTPIDLAYVAADDGRSCYQANAPMSDETSTRIDCVLVGYWQSPSPGEPGGPNAKDEGDDR